MMGCQREIAAKIIEKEADYVLALKGNQGTSCRMHAFGMTRADVELFFSEQTARAFEDVAVSRHRTLEKSHGRIETRTYTAIGDIDWLKTRHDWVAHMKYDSQSQDQSPLTPALSPEGRVGNRAVHLLSGLALGRFRP